MASLLEKLLFWCVWWCSPRGSTFDVRAGCNLRYMVGEDHMILHPPLLRIPNVQRLSNQGLTDIAYSPASTRLYLGSPAIVSLDGGTRLLCSHDTFFRGGVTYVLESLDGGQNWTQISSVDEQYWSSLFELGGALVTCN